MAAWVGLGTLALATLSAPPPVQAQQEVQNELQAAQEALRQQLEESARLEAEARAQREAEAQARRTDERAAKDEAEREAREAEQRATTRLQSDIDEQLRIQDELLRRAERNERATSRDDLGAHEDLAPAATGLALDSRIAPRAPVERELPSTIFEESRVKIPARTWGNPKKLALRRLVLDADGDGKPEIVRYVDPKTRLRVRQEEDRNYNGLMDSWTDYERGEIATRVLDSNDDGNPDLWERYRGGVAIAREVDRDDDGVKEGFYRYEAGSLVEERHDANNDGEIDLVIIYEDRQRVRAEEDHDRDGRTDSWTIYAVVDGVELVTRIEIDKQGRGFADTFEIFEPRAGKAILSRREEDVNGDGQVDVVSIYRKGKLVRREISNPDLVPLM